MIPSFFNSTERLLELHAQARAWEGTPFFANSEARGRDGGVDCVRLKNAIFSACRAIRHLDIPVYAMDHGQHSDRSLLIEAFETWPELRARFVRLPDCSPANVRPGDALCFLAGKVPHHGGIMLGGGEFLHALKPEGVHRMRLTAAVRGWRILGELAAVYRPLPLPDSQLSTLSSQLPAPAA